MELERHSSSKPRALRPTCVAAVRNFTSYDSERRQTFSLLCQLPSVFLQSSSHCGFNVNNKVSQQHK
ncbi:hypothetical protein EYF80_013462 [Liparis tanakae]|uniref:Uncharacterized protein n=1 Tax=Liparis tanakae TaxID=230148 RepID=A0A4Z2IGU7_9TELE|nr:hypothetical protein EYF80_013462 [Liparis tanakae]